MFALVLLAGCSNRDSGRMEDGLQIVVTTFPPYDWVRQIVGDTSEIDVTLLLDDGTDLHNYQPTVADMATIARCDLFIYIGGASDTWIEDALNNAASPNRVTVNLLDMLGDAVKEETHPDGTNHDHDTDHDHSDEETTEADEHIWLSLRCAQTLCASLAEQLALLDDEHAEDFRTNAERYNQQLHKLDEAYTHTVDTATRHTLLFADRFPFRYLIDDYALTYYAAFSGCSTETEASFNILTQLVEKANDWASTHILVLETSDKKIAETVIQNTNNRNQTILVLDTMQSMTAARIRAGENYLSVMEKNLQVLKIALQS